MAEEIKATYDQLEDISSKFGQQAELIQSMMQRVRSSYSQLEGGGWLGLGAEAFTNEMTSKIFPAWERLIAILSESSSCSMAVSGRFHQGEDEGKNLFRDLD